jgi:uncharacterized protein
MRRPLRILLAATLLTTAAQTSAQTKSAATINADPALWVVKDADTTIYLFGTIHLMKPEITWFDGGVKSAYDASSDVVIEMIEPSPQDAQKSMMSKAIDPDGPPLSQKLSPKTAAAYKKALENLNLPVGAFEQFEPWAASTILGVIPLSKYGFSPDSGVEKVLTAAAKKDGKMMGQLETMDEQLSFFDTLPEPLQIKLLEQTIKELPNYGKLVNTMVDSWAAGKPAIVGREINKSMKATPELHKVLLHDRNARWADWIVNRLKTPGTTFVAVGAGHLAGKDSVQGMLATKKIKAVRIPS